MATTNDTYPAPRTQAAAPKSAMPVHRHFPEIEAAMARLTAENAIKYGRTRPDATEAPRPTYTPIPATCQHTDRPAWPVSETQLCHECEDRRFRAEQFAIGARAAGFPVTEAAAVAMVYTLDTLASAVPARGEVAA